MSTLSSFLRRWSEHYSLQERQGIFRHERQPAVCLLTERRFMCDGHSQESVHGHLLETDGPHENTEGAEQVPPDHNPQSGLE